VRNHRSSLRVELVFCFIQCAPDRRIPRHSGLLFFFGLLEAVPSLLASCSLYARLWLSGSVSFEVIFLHFAPRRHGFVPWISQGEGSQQSEGDVGRNVKTYWCIVCLFFSRGPLGPS